MIWTAHSTPTWDTVSSFINARCDLRKSWVNKPRYYSKNIWNCRYDSKNKYWNNIWHDIPWFSQLLSLCCILFSQLLANFWIYVQSIYIYTRCKERENRWIKYNNISCKRWFKKCQLSIDIFTRSSLKKHNVFNQYSC